MEKLKPYNYIDMVRLCNKVAWEIADRREKKMRLIDADSLKYRRANYGGYDDVGEEERKRGILFLLKEDIAAAPTIDPVRHGTWLKYPGDIVSDDGLWGETLYDCSECGHTRHVATEFCSKCGAKMEQDGEIQVRWKEYETD